MSGPLSQMWLIEVNLEPGDAATVRAALGDAGVSVKQFGLPYSFKLQKHTQNDPTETLEVWLVKLGNTGTGSAVYMAVGDAAERFVEWLGRKLGASFINGMTIAQAWQVATPMARLGNMTPRDWLMADAGLDNGGRRTFREDADGNPIAPWQIGGQDPTCYPA